jgi:hypothetical protein
MSEAAKLKPITEPGVEVRVTHMVPTGPYDKGHQHHGQPSFADSACKSLSHLIGRQTITHEDACKLFLDAQKREQAAKQIREYWATVLQNWNELTEPVE